MQIVHNITQITTEFLLVDDEGNTIDRKTVQNGIQVLNGIEFQEAFNQLVEFRNEWREEKCQQE